MIRQSNKLTILLVTSLILNVFFIGLGVGLLLKKEKHKPPYFHKIDREFKDLLPIESREKHRQQQKVLRAQIKANHKETRDLRKQLASEIGKDQLDVEAVESLFKQIQTLNGNSMASSQAAMLESLKIMPVEARKRFAEKLKKRGKRGRKH